MDRFPKETLTFLRQLGRNNNREWFQANKHQYESAVLEPALEFIASMEAPLKKIAPHFRAIPKRQGGSLMRVYRDVRFSKDKRPYKTNIGIQFRHAQGKDVHAPGFYIHIEPGSVFFGAGCWHPESKTLRHIRDFIVDNPAAFGRIVNTKQFKAHFALAGESLKRPPRGYDADHPHIEHLKRKDFIAVRDLSPNRPFEPGFVKEVTQSLRAARPFVRYLCDALQVPY